MPTAHEIQERTRSIIDDAFESNTADQLTKRVIRERLQDHFDVDMTDFKKIINDTAQQHVNSKQGDDKENAGQEQKPSKSSKKPSSKKVDKVSDAEDFSELEDEVGAKKTTTRKPKAATPAKKPRTSTSSAASSTSKAGQSEAEQRLTHLKSLVTACGVRKPWKKLYEQANVAEDDHAGQIRIVSQVLKDLGMSGRGSLDQAKKIREKREFAEELAELQNNEVELKTGRGGRPSRATSQGKGHSAIEISDDDQSEQSSSEFGDSDDDSRAKKRKNSKRGSGESSDADDISPPKRRNFKSSLASFAADLNSDSD